MQTVNSSQSPSPSLDSSGSAGQTEVDSESDGLKNISKLSGDSLIAAQQRQIIAAAANKERRRRQILPKIAKEDRCGRCHHCLNPKLKKACITARKLQMKSLDDKEELPLFYKMENNKLNSKAIPPVRAKPASLSPELNTLHNQIQGLLTTVDNQVMIKPGKQALFVDLMNRPQMTWAVRIFILTAILALPLADRTMLVTLADRKGLHVLHSWLKSASDKAGEAEKFQLDVLKTLGVLPVDMAALKQVPIGKTVNGLAKRDPSQKVKAAAAKVVQQWRQNVGMADTDAKRPRLLFTSLCSMLWGVACCVLFHVVECQMRVSCCGQTVACNERQQVIVCNAQSMALQYLADVGCYMCICLLSDDLQSSISRSIFSTAKHLAVVITVTDHPASQSFSKYHLCAVLSEHFT